MEVVRVHQDLKCCPLQAVTEQGGFQPVGHFLGPMDGQPERFEARTEGTIPGGSPATITRGPLSPSVARRDAFSRPTTTIGKTIRIPTPVSYTHLRAHETDSYL